MHKHIFRHIPNGSVPLTDKDIIPDPLAFVERSKTSEHQNRLSFHETSQKLLKSEENES